MNTIDHTCTRRAMLKTLGAGALATAALPSLSLFGAESDATRLRNYPWLNQTSGPRPAFVWENYEDLIYHDLGYSDPTIESAPEFCAFMHCVWVFNRAMQWQRDPDTGLVVCYSGGGDLPLTGEKQVSAWHSDPDNTFEQHGAATRFIKRTTRRRRDCAVLPAFQFHLGQHPKLIVRVTETTGEWQFCVSVKGRSGPPLMACPWQKGPAEVTFDIATELARHGYKHNYAELHFVLGLWCPEAGAAAQATFEARLVGQPAIVPCLPIIRTADTALNSGLPLAAVIVGPDGKLLGSDDRVRAYARIAGKKVPLFADQGLWKSYVRYLKPGYYEGTVVAEGAVNAESPLSLRVTDGAFDSYDKALGSMSRQGEPTGPLTGSFQGTFFFRDVGTPNERMINGQKDWDAWDRTQPPGEHSHSWESLTETEFDQRFAYLAHCGWDLLHLNQHWGVWERLDAGGRIAPHGAEQLALYLRVADRHGLKSFFALTHYQYTLHRSSQTSGGTVPYSAYLEAGFKDEDWFKVGLRPFDKMFRQYLSDFVSLFQEETALSTLTASGEGDSAIGPRVQDIYRQVRSRDANHVFAAEPIHQLRKLPRAYCEGWPQDLFGFRTYDIGTDVFPEIDLGVAYKFARLGRLYLAEGSFAAAPRYVKFHNDVEGGATPESWTGTQRYRTRLRDTLYLGLVHQLPVLMLWDEQIAEDEHRLFKRIVQSINWNQPWQTPPVAIRVDDADVVGEGRAKLARYQKAFVNLPLSWQLLERNAPTPPGVAAVIDARDPYREPHFADIGGVLPEALKDQRPVLVAGNYGVSYLWSADRSTALAYVYNTASHVKLEAGRDLAGCFHREPVPEDLVIGLRHLPAGPLHYQVFDLSSHVLFREGYVREGLDIDMGRTDKDYFVVIKPSVRFASGRR